MSDRRQSDPGPAREPGTGAAEDPNRDRVPANDEGGGRAGGMGGEGEAGSGGSSHEKAGRVPPIPR